ncbi:MAG: multifunctional CCA addition/repair protein [Gammaproteobacteria bacterium]|nr:multifunctional CCA addition/repair protein [Gammaproteobacteria bacterium]
MKIYQVGGAVRDGLLGLPIVDRDWVVVGATPAELLALGYRQVGRDFPVFLHPTTHEEYALARTERKRGSGHHGFEFDTAAVVTLEEDLARRDVTINAIAADAHGMLIDPFDGQADLARRVLRHVTAAFVEDPLRVLRVARFAARFNFSVAAETVALMASMATNGELATLTPERVWNELEKALSAPYPQRFIEVLRECGALRVLFPDIDRLFGTPEGLTHHPEGDTGAHLLLALHEAARRAASPAVRFAVLLHDLGKGQTPLDVLPRHPGHEARSAVLADAFCQRWRAPNAVRELAILVARYHVKIHRALELRASTLVRLMDDLDAFRRPARVSEILLACEIDAAGRAFPTPRPYPAAAHVAAALDAAQNIDIASIVTGHANGEAIKAAIHAARVAAVRKLTQA